MRSWLAAGGAVALLAAAPAQAKVAAYPSPGTLTASPRTQISLRGIAPRRIGTVTVKGSRSGRHTGRLRAHSDGQGASFVPSRPFRAGERVTVRNAHVTYGFSVGRRPTPSTPRPTELPGVGGGAVQRFATRPDLVAPAVTIDTRLDGRAPGLVFLAPKSGRGQDGPMIIDDAGQVVWFNAIGNRELATDFRVQNYLGKPVLTWWQGRLSGGEGRGEGKIYDSRYQPVRRVRAGNGFSADVHEFELTSRGTALLLIYDAVERDLRSVGGRQRGIVGQTVVQEIDIATGLVLFEWHSLGNVGLSESHQPVPRYGGQWDYMHANSAALDASGDVILSARHTSAVYRISHSTGRIVWRLGGTKSDFQMGEGTRFYQQHDARPQPDGSLTLFDNSAPPPQRKASRAITLALDTTAMKATLRNAFTHPRGLLSATQGGVQVLANGNTFVGWGSRRYFTEFDASGKVVFDGHLALGGDNYRAYRFLWSGRPARPPALIAQRRGTRVTARVSWNGATGVAAWELWAGPTPNALARVKSATRAGFETAISASTSARYVAVKALDASGAVLGTSAAIRPR